MTGGYGAHFRLSLPNPRDPKENPPRPLPLSLPSAHTSWIEVERLPSGRVDYFLGAQSRHEAMLTADALASVYPGAAVGRGRICPLTWQAGTGLARTALVRARAVVRSHYWGLRLVRDIDHAALLLRRLSPATSLPGTVILQLLFRPVPRWEHGFLGKTYTQFLSEHPKDALLEERQFEPPFHVDIRAAGYNVPIDVLLRLLWPWVGSWTSTVGGGWWTLEAVREKRKAEFLESLRDHDIFRFASRKSRRDLSAPELAALLPFPWQERFPNLPYAGAPEGRPPIELLAEPTGDRGSGIVVGTAGGSRVRLPRAWNHLAILGRTRSGKSTLARSIALQILAKEPTARVVVLEPTGTLIQGIVDRLPLEVAADTVEVDPSRASFEEGGVEKVAVPLNLLQLPARGTMEGPELERRVEKLSGDLLQSIKNAWGEESVGGRADFILRSVVQGLLAVEGTNLVDAYSVLSDKKALTRLESLRTWSPIGNGLKALFPKLDSTITISSLDKVGKVAENPLLRKSLCQRYGAVPFAQLLKHRLLLLNLGKGALGTEGATFLGAILLTQLWSSLQERTGGEPPVYLVVDEFHNYAIPAFADMLSEGARLGLHVVAVTQYLNRIPEKVRSPLVGNVDAWAMFTLGAEDMREAWKVVQGRRFGWTPEDLVGGLGPHEAAFFAAGSLVKLSPSTPQRPTHDGVDRQGAVNRSSRRYARAEDSQASPLAVSPSQLVSLIGNLLDPGATPPEALASDLGWTPVQVRAAVALGRASGDLAEGPDGQVRLLPRGRFYREAVLAARNEGEEHCRLLADTMVFLEEETGVHGRVVPQGSGYLEPDGEFERNGRTYSVEVECSTLVKQTEQVVRNVRKALGARRRCLLVVPDRPMAERLALLVTSEVPETQLWGNVGILFRDLTGKTTPYMGPDGQVWPWMAGGKDGEGSHAELVLETAVTDDGSPPNSGPVFADKDRVRELAFRAFTAGKEWGTADDLIALASPWEKDALDDRRVGMAMALLGVPNRRVRLAGKQCREYYFGSVQGTG